MEDVAKIDQNLASHRGGAWRKLLVAAIAVMLATGCKSGSNTFNDLIGSADGGTGTASIGITTYSPGSASYVIKKENTQQFLVSAVGKGTLVYKWTLDGTEVGTDSPTITLDATQLSVGTKALKVTIRDEVGSVSQEWSVKINGTPVISTSSPTVNSVNLRRLTALTYSVTVTDPNTDTLTYVWKLDGQEGVLSSTTSSQAYTPAAVDVGSHTISVDIYDGPASDAGTYKVTRSWTTYVNNFADACNKMENESQTNKTCVLSGIAGIGDGVDPESAATSIMLRPTAIEQTAAGNLFVADDENNVVWFWNKYSSPSITVLGVVVPQNTIKVVVGAGYSTANSTASPKARRGFFNNIHGLHWDGTHLYLSDASANRVVRVDSSGDLTVVNSAGCNSPRGLTKVGNQLYIACYSSHIIRVVDTDTLVGSTYAGTGAAGDPTAAAESTFTHATEGRLRGPYGITKDSEGNLYVAEYDGCRVRFYNRATNPTKTFYGSWTVSLNAQRIILGAAAGPNCGAFTAGEAVNLTAGTDARVRQLRGISFDSNGNLLLIGDNMFRGIALNFNVGSTTVLGTTVPGYSIASVLGNGTNAYIGEGQLASATRISTSYAFIQESVSGNYFVADRDNRRFRRINNSDNKTELIAGNGSYRSLFNSGQGTIEVSSEKMNQPRGFAYDTVTGQIFVADSANFRIRVINRYGEVSQAVGTGTTGTGAEEDEFPTNSTMNLPRGLVLTHATTSPAFGGHLVWADSANHRVRLWNRSSAQATLFGVTVGAGKVATIGGNGSTGNATSGSALVAAFNEPSGVAFDGTNLYVADRNNACIKRIDPTGTLSVTAGTCGTTGNTNGPVGTGRMTQPEGIAYYSSGVHTGLLIAATGNTRIKFHRFTGTTLLFGSSTSIGDTNSIACGTAAAAGTFHTESVGATLAICSGLRDVTSYGSRFCFTNDSYHNVRCVNSNGEMFTAIGAVQGIDDTTNLYFPGVPFSDATWTTGGNAATQNGVTAFYLPSPLVDASSAPALSQDLGYLVHPRAVYMIDANTLLVGDLIGLIRKVKLP